MESTKIILSQNDKYQTVIYPHLTNDKTVLGSVVILHGMAEHHDRYNEFANFLCSKGYDVFLYDHRGHGKDKKYEELGHIANNGGYRLLISDAINVLKYVGSNNRGESLILFGHSMGSLIARCVLAEYDDVDAAIIAGTAHEPNLKTAMGCLISSLIKFLKSPGYRSPFLANQTTGYKSFAKISNRTKFDWLTRDNAVVGQYINDAYCGYPCTAAFYYDLIKLTRIAGSPKTIRKVRRDLPVLIISGTHDPVGNYAQGVAKYFALLQKYGFSASNCVFYDECRHELLNELNKDEVMYDIYKWITENATAEPSSEVSDHSTHTDKS